MKLAIAAFVLTGCSGFTTMFSVGFSKGDQRIDAAVTLTPTGKRVVSSK